MANVCPCLILGMKLLIYSLVAFLILILRAAVKEYVRCPEV